jgi:Ribbon-helix-helix domain
MIILWRYSMAKKVLRNRTQITSTIDPNLHEALRKLSEETDIPISKLLDKGIQLLLEDFKKKGLYNPK